MIIFVGSTNPIKIKAVQVAAQEQWPQVQVRGLSVPSQVSPQPRSDEETYQGALNRANAVLAAGLAQIDHLASETYLGIGLEGGVFDHASGQLWSTVWVVVTDGKQEPVAANGARFAIPEVCAAPIRAGAEMGPVMDQLTKSQNISQNQGMIGIVTDGYVNRQEEYAGIAKLALGLWYGRPSLSVLSQSTVK